ncbi:hypothetical protein CPLU01_12941 [Colletotrichum plurivorum]|uniref:Heterokaryon incompatibility domain-containing protein n=1 Tax=Colletotrichum plurivorum TaxID=2175906 RepID=A0A8H6JW47_9PEZI|nr:hypothetical protein CPLU01_12941 [Colletotrichum plurivorum]
MGLYRQLVDSSRSICGLDRFRWALRYATLEPGTGSQPISCRLTQSSLGASKGTYEALSYAWGDTTSQVNIQLDGQSFLVTRNLATALSCLRHPKKERALWIDAICINQSDAAEAALQVRRMWAIYRYSSRVAVFLGDAGPGTRKAFKLVKNLARNVRHGDYPRITAMLADEGLRESWGALQELMARPWLNRAWVVQEYAVATDVVFLCGKLKMPGQTFSKALDILGDYKWNAPIPPGREYFVRHVIPTPISHLSKTRTEYQESGPEARTVDPVSVLYRFRGRESSDPRDKVYSLFHLMGDNGMLKPDYGKSVQSLYKDVVRASIESSKSLVALNHHNRTVPCGVPGLPTWCPDWTVPRGLGPRIPLWSNGYTAGGDGGPLARFEGESLILKGRVLEKVSWVTTFEPTTFKNRGILLDLIKTAEARYLSERLEANMANRSELLDAFRRTIVASRIREKGPRNEFTVLEPSDADELWESWLETIEDESSGALQGKAKIYGDALYTALVGRSFFLTESGHLGIADNPVQPGCILGVFPGSRVLLCLQERESDTPERTLVCRSNAKTDNDSYLHGFMDGEAMNTDDPLEEIRLI